MRNPPDMSSEKLEMSGEGVNDRLSLFLIQSHHGGVNNPKWIFVLVFWIGPSLLGTFF